MRVSYDIISRAMTRGYSTQSCARLGLSALLLTSKVLKVDVTVSVLTI